MNIFCISKGYWLINYDLWALGIKQNLCAVDTPDTSLLIELTLHLYVEEGLKVTSNQYLQPQPQSSLWLR